MMNHSPMGFETMEHMLQAMIGTDCTPIIKPQWNDPVIIKRILDIGAHGIVVRARYSNMCGREGFQVQHCDKCRYDARIRCS